MELKIILNCAADCLQIVLSTAGGAMQMETLIRSWYRLVLVKRAPIKSEMNGLDTTMTAASRSLDMIQAQFLQQTLQIAQEALASKFLP